MAVSIYVDGSGCNYVGAVADGERLIEYRIEKKNKTVTTGSVFKGRVENVLEGMQAAFIDVGLDKNGYLSAGDMLMDKSELESVELPSVSSLKVGDEVMVQAVKDPSGNKGVRLTFNLSFAGRFVVFMPTIDFVGVSRKITDVKKREKLLNLAKAIKPDGGGIIIRTAGAGASGQALKKELSLLINQYGTIEQKFSTMPAPSCIYEEGNMALRLIRDVYNPKAEKFVVSDEKMYAEIMDFAKRYGGSLKNKLRLYDKNVDMFRYFGLDKEVNALLQSRVNLGNGAYIVIDKTEALTAIDVNSGGYVGGDNLEETVFSVNVAAAREIARQLRLRNISGIIIVDFIDMTEEEHKKQLLAELEKAFAEDREKATVVGMTSLGLVEITRKKRRKESVSMLLKPCPYCQGNGYIQSNDYTAMRVRTGLMDIFADGYKNAVIDMNAEIADYIISGQVLKNDMEKIWQGKRVFIIPHKTYHQHFFLIKGDNSKVMDLPDKAITIG